MGEPISKLDLIDVRLKALNAARADTAVDCQIRDGPIVHEPTIEIVLDRAEKYFEFLMREYPDRSGGQEENENLADRVSPGSSSA